MDKIALIGDIHANLTALQTVLEDIKKRNISNIYCLGDIVSKGVNPDLVIDLIKENCDVVIKGNCDEIFSSERALKSKFWTRMKIGDKRAKYLQNLPVMHEFYCSGRLIRLFHASPYSLEHIYNPIYDNQETKYANCTLNNPMELFKNTDFIGKNEKDKVPDIIGYAHLHMPNLFEIENKIIFNTGSVGASTNIAESSYTIIEGYLNSKIINKISISNIMIPYDIKKEIEIINKSKFPLKNKLLSSLKK